jgi:hypothetical protein
MSTTNFLGLATSPPFSQTRVSRSPRDDLIGEFRPATQASIIFRGGVDLKNSKNRAINFFFFKKILIMAVCQECWQFNYIVYSRSQCGILQYEPAGWDFAQKIIGYFTIQQY